MSFRDIFPTLQNYSLKLDSYLDVYEKTFEKFKNKRPIILEIGVRGGGGIELLHKYFNGNCEIYGVDIDERVLQINNIYPDAKIYLGDQANKQFMKYVAENIGKPIDIIIDDGGHFMHQQINSFEALFPYINNDGVYLIEDVSTSLQSKFNNGTTPTFIEYIHKNTIDVINAFSCNKSMYSIEFYQEIIIVHKKPKSPFKFISCDRVNGYKIGFKLEDSIDPFQNV